MNTNRERGCRPIARAILMTYLSVLLGSSSAGSASLSFSSIELLTDRSSIIVVGKVILASTTGAELLSSRKITMLCGRTLKGQPQTLLDLDSGSLGTVPKVDTELLLFLTQGKVVGKVSLSRPLDIAFDPPITNDLNVSEERDSILASVSRRLERTSHRKAPRRELCIQMPSGSPAERATFWTLSGNYLIVPADSELVEPVLRNAASADPERRAFAARCLAAYPGPETNRVLIGLLKDEGAVIWNMESAQPDTQYIVRSAAWTALRELGVSVARPEKYTDLFLGTECGYLPWPP